jgi:hypothetical protein
LAALVVLVCNDWWLKGAGVLPTGLTGKLSDFAGLLFFPLLLTAVFDTLLWGVAQLGAPVDFTLRRSKLLGAVAITGALFSAVKLSPVLAASFADALGILGVSARVVSDRTDLFALPALAVAYWLGTHEIAEMPLGRLEWIERKHKRGDLHSIRAELDDVLRAGADEQAVDVFARALSSYLARPDNELCRANLSQSLLALRTRRAISPSPS